MTLAHEVGHSCGLCDIFIVDNEKSPTLSIIGEPVGQEKMPMDWANGYHPPGITQDEIVKRLLMHAHPDATGVLVPRGDIHGIGITNGVFKTGMWRVGLEGMIHPPLNHL